MSDLEQFLRQFQNKFDSVQQEDSTNSKFASYNKNGEYNDVPSTDDDDDYHTHVAMPFSEAADEEEEVPQEEVPQEEVPQEEVPQEEMPADGMDEAGMDEAGMGGMGEEEKEGPETREEAGQIYELKKIYSRLVAIEQHLNTATEDKLIEIRKYVAQSIELFQMLISNFDLYKEKIDDITITYYKFIDFVYDLLSKHYKGKK